MKSFPSHFDLDSDEARLAAFKEELDRIDGPEGTSSAHEKLLNPGGLFTETGYTDALISLAEEMKAKREAKKRPKLPR